jgi:hypothetical protein
VNILCLFISRVACYSKYYGYYFKPHFQPNSKANSIDLDSDSDLDLDLFQSPIGAAKMDVS